MRRVALTLVGAMLLALLPVSVGGCNITCGCASTPDPNWTPPPITAEEAAVYAAKAAGVPVMTAQLAAGWPAGRSTGLMLRAPWRSSTRSRAWCPRSS